MKLVFLCLLAGAAACGVPLEREPVVCPPDAEVPRYSELNAVATCTGCHDSTLVGADRNGAPTPINFGTFADASRASVIGLSAMDRGAMPPGGPLDEADITAFKLWSECGRPE